MLRWRLLLGAIFIAAMIGLGWLDQNAQTPGIWLLPLGVLLVVLSSQELMTLLGKSGVSVQPWVVYVGNTTLFLGNWLSVFCPGGLPKVLSGVSAIENAAISPSPGSISWPGSEILLIFAVGVLVAFLDAMFHYEKPGGVIAKIAGTLFCLVYVGLLFGFLVQLRLSVGMGALGSLIIVVKLGDIGAYTLGRLFGRHKMAPKLSPGKTWEGAVGAILFACLGSWISFQYLIPYSVLETIPAGFSWGWIVYGILLGITGMLGDLAESLIKRDSGQKDSSTWLPGFGGILDIVDSLLLAAPVACLCWAVGMVGH